MTALAANIDATQTLVSVDVGLTNGTFQYPLYFTVDFESIRVVGRAHESTWLVDRGIAGTTAATHSSAATLTRYYPDGATGVGGGGAIAVTDGAADEVLLQIDAAVGQTGSPLLITTEVTPPSDGKLFEIKASGTTVILGTNPNDVVLHVASTTAAQASDIFTTYNSGGDLFSVLNNGAVDMRFRGDPDGTALLRIRPQEMNSGPTADILQAQNWWGEPVHGVTKNGYTYIQAGGAGGPTENAPADAELVAGQMILWFDDTNGAGKLMIKAKTANGTVVTGNVALA